MSPLHAESDKQVGTRQLTFTIKRRHRECFNDEGTVVLTFKDRGYEFIGERLTLISLLNEQIMKYSTKRRWEHSAFGLSAEAETWLAHGEFFSKRTSQIC